MKLTRIGIRNFRNFSEIDIALDGNPPTSRASSPAVRNLPVHQLNNADEVPITTGFDDSPQKRVDRGFCDAK